MAIAENASTPTPTHQAQGTTGTCISAAFSPPASTLVVAAVAWMFAGTNPKSSSLSVKDSLGNNYSQGAEMDNAQENDTAIYIFYYASAPGSITVTVTCTNTALAAVLLAPRVLTGASSLQSGAGTVTDNDDASMHIVTSATGSWVYCVGAAPTDKRPPTSDVTLTQIDLFQDAGTGNQAAVGRLTGSTGVPGKTWTGWTGNMAQGCALEILPSPAVILGTAGHPGPTWQTGQVLASADVNTWISPLAQQKTAATARKSTTVLTSDPDLQLPFTTMGNWAVRMLLAYDGVADLEFGFAVPAGATFYFAVAYVNSGDSPVLEAHKAISTFSDTVVADATTAGTLQGVIVDGLLVMDGTPGSLSLLWAQSASNATPTNLDQNSYMIAWRLG